MLLFALQIADSAVGHSLLLDLILWEIRFDIDFMHMKWYENM